MPITSLTCTSRQARTQRLHWMQASRLTAIAGWLRSGAGVARRGNRLAATFCRVGGLPELGMRIVRHVLRRLVGQQELEHHAPRSLGAIGLRLDLHARRRRANAACRQHALAFDLDHADAAIAVGPIAGLGRVAQMRQLDAVAPRGAENGLAVAALDVAAVEREACMMACRHRRAAASAGLDA